MQDLFIELIQVSIGKRSSLSHTPSAKKWEELYHMAKCQAILGICFVGVKRLQKAQQVLPAPIFMQWLAITTKIQQRNEDMDKKTAEVWALLNKAGLDCAVLKGQGVASLYSEHLRGLRQSGDIDVWVKGGFDKVNAFVQRTAPTKDLAYHRFHYDAFPDTEVELHFRPTLMRNLFDNKKLQKWCDGVLLSEFVKTDLGFNVPPARFNRIFILTHIYRHFLFEGVGLRQLMDYYFVLKARNNDDTSINSAQAVNDGFDMLTNRNDNLNPLLKEFRLTRFASALMWVMGHVFALDRKYMIYEPDEKEGRFLLDEIMQTGNFGHGETRYNGFGTFKRMTIHGLHLLLHYPSEVIWTPIWLVYHKIWKMKYKRKTR